MSTDTVAVEAKIGQALTALRDAIATVRDDADLTSVTEALFRATSALVPAQNELRDITRRAKRRAADPRVDPAVKARSVNAAARVFAAADAADARWVF